MLCDAPSLGSSRSRSTKPCCSGAGKYEAALERLAAIHDEDLAIEIRRRAGQYARPHGTPRRGDRRGGPQSCNSNHQTPSDEDAWYFVAALELRLRFELGLDPEGRSRALALLRETSENEHALALIRDTRRTRQGQLLIPAHRRARQLSQADVGADGFYAPYDVVARDPDALPYIEEIESARGFDHSEISCESPRQTRQDPKGVYRVKRTGLLRGVIRAWSRRSPGSFRCAGKSQPCCPAHCFADLASHQACRLPERGHTYRWM
ncbi:MAG: hypothetical protein R3F17_02150 [Planctomycetota bacterium]